MFDALIRRFRRELARWALGLVFSAHFMRRRALAVLNRHYAKGELVLRYRMRDHTLYLDPADDVITPRILLRGDWQRRDLERVIAILAAHVPRSRGGLFINNPETHHEVQIWRGAGSSPSWGPAPTRH